MTYHVHNKQELESVWSRVAAGDAVVIHVSDTTNYNFTFKPTPSYKWGDKSEWSGCCC